MYRGKYSPNKDEYSVIVHWYFCINYQNIETFLSCLINSCYSKPPMVFLCPRHPKQLWNPQDASRSFYDSATKGIKPSRAGFSQNSVTVEVSVLIGQFRAIPVIRYFKYQTGYSVIMAIYHSSALLSCTFIARLPVEKRTASSFFKNEIRLSWRFY